MLAKGELFEDQIYEGTVPAELGPAVRTNAAIGSGIWHFRTGSSPLDGKEWQRPSHLGWGTARVLLYVRVALGCLDHVLI